MNICINAIRIKLGNIDLKYIRFLFVGGFNTLIGFTLFPTVYWIFKSYRSHYVIMLTLCHVLAVLCSYLTNKFLVFRSKGNPSVEMLKFGLFHLGFFLIMVTGMPFLVEIGHLNPVTVQFFLSVCAVLASFFWYDKVVFPSKEVI